MVPALQLKAGAAWASERTRRLRQPLSAEGERSGEGFVEGSFPTGKTQKSPWPRSCA